jgi:hypothetical protein
MNMCKLGAGHPKGPTCGLKSSFPSGSPPSELPPSESPGCLPSNGWWSEPLGIWVGKLVVTYIVVSIGVITCCWTGCLSLLVTSWTTIVNWFQPSMVYMLVLQQVVQVLGTHS